MECFELLNDLKIKETVLNKQINIKIGVERRKLENLANIVGDIVDSIRENKDVHFLEIPDLESEESAAHRKILTENLPIQIYPNKIKNRIVFKIKTGYKLELVTPETMKLLGSTKKDVDKDRDKKKCTKIRIC